MIGGLLYHYDVFGRISRWFSSFRIRTREKFRLRWFYQYNPQSLTFDDFANEFTLSKDLSKLNLPKEDVLQLQKLMLALDGKLKYGFSRELVANALQSEEMDAKYAKQKKNEEKKLVFDEHGNKVLEPMMDKKKYNAFLSESGFRSAQKMMTSSMTPKDLVQIIDDFSPSNTETSAFANDLMSTIKRLVENEWDAKFQERIYNLDNPEMAQKIKDEKAKREAAEKAAALEKEENEKKAS